MMTGPNRAEIIMGRGMVEQRSSVRTPVCLSGTISWRGQGEKVALVRDVSDSGAFLYSNFSDNAPPPDLGQELTLSFSMVKNDRRVEMLCRGRVVRLVDFPTGAATGIALQLNRCEAMPRMEV